MGTLSTSTVKIKFGRLSIQEILLFLFWPFAALIYGLKQYKSPKAITFFWLFCTYFGFSFVIPENTDSAADSARYAAKLEELHAEPLSFNQLKEVFYSKESGVVDIYEPLVTWFISLFTGNAAVLFAIYAAVFGLFYAKNTWIILYRIDKIDSLLLFLFIMVFVLVNPIWNINGVRMWTSAQIFIYGALSIFFDKKKSGWLWVVSSVFVHFSFAFPVALLILFSFLPLNLAILFLFYFFTLTIAEIDLKVVKNLLAVLPDFLQGRVTGYTNEEYAMRMKSAADNYSWHVVLANQSLKWIKNFWILILFIFKKQWIVENPIVMKIFGLALFIGGFANVTLLIPSGGRFTHLANVLFFAVFTLLVSKDYFKNIQILKRLTIPFLAFSILFTVRMGFDYMGFTAIFGNPLIAAFVDAQMPLIDFVKWLF